MYIITLAQEGVKPVPKVLKWLIYPEMCAKRCKAVALSPFLHTGKKENYS